MARGAIVLALFTATFAAPDARAGGESGVNLGAIARASGRPEECAAPRVSRWERARTPGLGAYCDALARGYAALATSVESAVKNADAAEAALPGRAAPAVLRARAQSRSGAHAVAWDAFSRARALSPTSLDAPAALHDYAITAFRTGHSTEALAAYRALVPRAELLGDRREEVVVLVEAAAAVSLEGKAALPQALGYLSEARRRSLLPGLRDVVLGELALTLARAERRTEEDAVVLESAGPSWLEAEREKATKGGTTALPVLPAGELDAMIAVLAERSDRDLARDRWESFLATEAGKSGPFAALARARRDALVRGSRR